MPPSKPAEAIERCYGWRSRGGFYDLELRFNLQGRDGIIRRAALEMLRPREGGRYLDVGIGTGRDMPHFACAPAPGASLVGIDITPGMLATAARRARRLGVDRIHLARADAARLPFRDASFDGVLSLYTFNVVPEPLEALDEAWRVLKPGGRLVLGEFRPLEGRLSRLNGLYERMSLRNACADINRRVYLEMERRWGPTEMRTFLSGAIYVCAVSKAGAGARRRER